jgi:putative nucleotidyltransferase with HDIG domain
LKEGESAAFELGLYDLHPEITRLMGRLKFRTSYGQNVLNHSKEVAFLAGIMAKEVGLDAHVTTRAAFVHDIGKAIDRDLSGTHLELGIDFLRKHGETEPVVMAMAAHHMGAARSAPRHPRVVRQAPREARRDRRLVQGRLEGLRAPGRTRDPHPGREREDLRRRSRVALEGHRAPD